MRAFLFFCVIFPCVCVEGAWLDRKAEGWAWYEDRKEDSEEIQNQKKRKNPQEEMETAKEILQEKLALAIMDPTEENIKGYMVEQKKRVQQSKEFAKSWEKLLLRYPELDPTATEYPVSHYGITVRKEIDSKKKRDLVAKISQENGLFFFYEGGSLISQAVSSIVKRFATQYAWKVTAISIDGILLKDFPDSKVNEHIAKEMGVTTFPALFVFDPMHKTATPVSYGMVSLDQIEENIVLQFNEEDTSE